MGSTQRKKIGHFYLLLVPIIAAVLGFGVGPVSHNIYLPIWLLNVICMTVASWWLGLHVIKKQQEEQKNLARAAFFLIVPWIFISMFAGLGPPPETPAAWIASESEQKVRYFWLVISGVFLVLGFAGIMQRLKSTGETFYSLLGIVALMLAIPLFLINMLYWGFYLPELFRIQTSSQAAEYPEWSVPIRQLFGMISVAEVALTYFATFAFAVSMRKAGWLSKTGCVWYSIFSWLGFAIVVLSAFITETLKVPGFAVSIPAFPMLMPYYMGVHLLSKTGNDGPSI